MIEVVEGGGWWRWQLAVVINRVAVKGYNHMNVLMILSQRTIFK